MIEQADARLADVEGQALEDLTGRLHEERSRRASSDLPLSSRIQGYWDRSGVDINLVAICEDERRMRFGTCNRNPDELPGVADDLKPEWVGIAPTIPDSVRDALQVAGIQAQSLTDMIEDCILQASG